MLETPAAKAGATLVLAGILGAQPFGVSLTNIGIGMGFAIVGVIGRGFIEIAKTIEKGDSVKLTRSIAWMGAGVLGSPFISTLYMAILTGIHYPVDAFTAVVLVGLGYAGPKSAADLMGFAQRFIPSRVNPQAQGGSSGNDPH